MTSPRIYQIIDPNDILDGIGLYHRVFRSAPEPGTVAPRLLAALARQGGIVLGADAPGGGLAGFAYGFLGMAEHSAEPYFYLQLIVVDPGRQNTGTGRAMMHHLADLVRRRGLHRLRWAFDPTDTRNAHFYLDVIGARGTQFIPDMYGADPVRPSHRVIADWDLRLPPTSWRGPADAPQPGVARHDGSCVLLTVDTGHADTTHAVCDHLDRLMSAGYDLVASHRVDGRAVLRLARPQHPAAQPQHHRMITPGERPDFATR